MNAEIKARWLEALRSGNYEQGIGFLNNNERFCCLGVLCEVQGIKFEQSPIRAELSGYIFPPLDGYEPDKTNGLLSLSHAEEMGLSESEIDYLVEVNDSGWSFEKIADWIEKNL